MSHNKILIVDDEPHVRKALQRSLIDEDYVISTAQNGSDALELLAEEQFQVVISDERMPGMQGSELLSIISLRWPETVRILLTGQASLEAAVRAVNEGEIFRFLLKPWNDMELRMAIRSGIEKYDSEMKNRKLLALMRKHEMKPDFLADKSPIMENPEGRNQDGSYSIPDLTDAEIAKIIKQCQLDSEDGTP